MPTRQPKNNFGCAIASTVCIHINRTTHACATHRANIFTFLYLYIIYAFSIWFSRVAQKFEEALKQHCFCIEWADLWTVWTHGILIWAGIDVVRRIKRYKQTTTMQILMRIQVLIMMLKFKFIFIFPAPFWSTRDCLMWHSNLIMWVKLIVRPSSVVMLLSFYGQQYWNWTVTTFLSSIKLNSVELIVWKIKRKK